MKKIYSKIALFFIAVLVSTSIFADNFEKDGIWYNTTSDSTAEVITSKGSSYSGDIVVPSSVEYNSVTYKVTSIAARACNDYYGLRSVTLEEGITEIGEDAFRNCLGLINVTLPSTISKIGKNAFRDCTVMTNIVIPNTAPLTVIEEAVFQDCKNLTGISLPDNLTEIGRFAFLRCYALESIVIPASVVKIGGSAFCLCEKLKSINIPEGVTEISEEMLSDCSGLTDVTIPNTVTKIGIGAFAYCTGLTEITIPNSVTEIGGSVFGDCTSLKSINLPNSVIELGGFTFYGCSALENAVIGDNVKSIQAGTFYECTSLKHLTLGSGLQNISQTYYSEWDDSNYIYNPFKDCIALDTIVCKGKVPAIAEDGVFSELDKTKVQVIVPCNTVSVYQAADGWKDFENINEYCNITVTTEEATDITNNSAKLHATADSEKELTAKGFIYRRSLGGESVKIDITTETFATVLTDLAIDTRYYYLAFIVTGNDTTFGEEKSFVTLDGNAIAEVENNNVTNIYPNPAKDVVVIENAVSNQENITINVYDAQGRLVLSATEPNAASHTLDVTSLKSGVYYIKAGNVTKQLVIE